ncbi:MAG: SOS response-associated peptidase, partial [Bifidobacteriaceae bacterium]|nr:SOS response-associated peptidase [Bifidobacteriaceae bacterium]
MCGRFVSYFDPADLAGVFDADRLTELPGPSWNIAPTSRIALVRELVETRPAAVAPAPADPGPADALATRVASTDAAPGERGRGHVREIRAARWGLVPSWAKDVGIGARLINARSETVTAKPAFRSAAKSRRALIPAAGYYEWQAGGQGPKTPFFLHPEDEGLVALAALYEGWRPPGLAPTPSGDPEVLVSAAIVTRAATDRLGAIHDRMPLIVPPDLWEPWLSPDLNTP